MGREKSVIYHGGYWLGLLLPFTLFFSISYHTLKRFQVSFFGLSYLEYLLIVMSLVTVYKFLKGLKKEKGFANGFKEFQVSINTFFNHILLIPAYLIGIGLSSIVAKVIGKHFLDIKISKKETYWEDLDLKKKPIEKYYKQF